ncbi:heterogeneous nuclear ribonucleoprotein M-like isoform X2 [Homarus americanus]|uniref:heterogeneous nuclear ribonucleoprotein M-like isoform X2 n=1 Tax=Homarus americanus TaxID=6706 RepID=UPI001C48B9F9|nr:heterogeneous nuclear ribonucleoprotein M-like isoform X2 [Homarus americanus]
MDMADESGYKKEGRDRSRSPVDDDSRDMDGENDRGGDRGDRNRRMDRGRRTERSRGGSKRGSADTRIYVSNIPYEYKWQDLKDLFRKEVGEVAYVEMFNDENNRPRGCAVIEFESVELVSKAVEIMHRYELKGRKLVVKESGPSRQDFDSDRERHTRIMKSDMRGGRDFARGADLGGPPSNKYGNTYGLSTVFLESLGITGPLVSKVFVANLDYKVDDKMLKDVFKIAGKVNNVEISKDQDGKSRGFGVVEFEHPVEAVQAISMFHNQTYYDRKMSVRMDRVTEKQESSSTKLPPGLKSLGMGLGVNGSALTDVATLPNTVATGVTAMPAVGAMASNMGNMGGQGMGMMGMGGSAGMGTGMGAGMGTGMGNMGAGMGNMGAGMGNMGAGMGNMGAGMGAGMGTGMGNMGTGMNNMGNGMGSSLMGGMGGAGMGTSSSMVSSLAGGVGAGIGGTSGIVSPSMSRGNIGSSGGGYGLSRDYNHGSGGTSASNSNYSGGYRNIIQLSNLPMDYTWQSLRDLCREFGDIRFAEIRSKGTGTVRFQTEADARRAVEMLDRQRLDGRILDVILL